MNRRQLITYLESLDGDILVKELTYYDFPISNHKISIEIDLYVHPTNTKGEIE